MSFLGFLKVTSASFLVQVRSRPGFCAEDSGAHQEVKRKASLEVPARLLKGASGLKLQLVLDGEGAEEFDCEALNVRLVGNRRLERLLLRLDLEIRGKG